MKKQVGIWSLAIAGVFWGTEGNNLIDLFRLHLDGLCIDFACRSAGFRPAVLRVVFPSRAFTEFLSRLVPPRFQIDLSGKISGAPVRYGFTLGMMGIAFIGGNACCSLCTFTHMQNIVSSVFGDTLGISYLASFSIVRFVLWLYVLGLFSKGGRGWFNFLCPARAIMGLAHWAGSQFKVSRLVKIDLNTCTNCKSCVTTSPAWAISNEKGKPAEINSHACTACMDCARACPVKAIRYSPASTKEVVYENTLTPTD